MRFERTIKVAFDKNSGEILEADQVFDKAKPAFKVRRQFHKSEVDLYCCECEQKLNVSGSKYDRLHFKHQPKSEPCLLKDNQLSPEESDQFYRIYQSKESDRHKELKHAIGQKLSKLKGVSDIHIDDRFISDDKERRKPDVYCKYNDKELVFEIQLSALSLRYILDRYEFYKRNKMYLIWILDDFDVQGQSQMVRDIKYLTEFQNFFKLDEKSSDFRLNCEYKYPYLTDRNQLWSKWLTKSVDIHQIKFSSEYYQIYYFNFEQKRNQKEREQEEIELRREEEERKRQKAEELERANQKTNYFLDLLRSKWVEKAVVYEDAKKFIKSLDEFQLEVLNNSQAFKAKQKEPRLHHWFSIAQKEHFPFLAFMVGCFSIELDYNEKSSSNKSLLETLFENEALGHKLYLTKEIIKRDYQFQRKDEQLIKDLPLPKKDIESNILLFQLAQKLNTPYHTNTLFEHRNLFCTIESAKQQKIVGFGYKPDEWIAFANNAIHSYNEYWDYIEIAFRKYGIWDKLIELDKNGTFQKKLGEFYQLQREPNFDCDRLFKSLYPELVESKNNGSD